MIEIGFQRENSRWCSFQSNGHSGFQESGKDIVCAAISAILQTALLGVLAFSHSKPNYTMRDGYLRCPIEKSSLESEETQIQSILSTAVLGCLNIAIQYPTFVTIQFSGLENWTNNKKYNQKDLDRIIDLIQ